MALDDVNNRALRAAADGGYREKFIESQMDFIRSCAAHAKHGQVSKHDDEWSVALVAFSRALDRYDSGKGDFEPFAASVIRNSLIDHYRAQNRFSPEIASESDEIEAKADTGVAKASEGNLKAEIEMITSILKEYGITFTELCSCSPKEERTREACASAVRWMLRDSAALDEMRRSAKLPIGAIVGATGVRRKTVDRHRRYIIAATEILSHDLPGIAEYLGFIGADR